VTPPVAPRSWKNDVAVLIAGIAIFLVSLAFNFLGDGLRDVLDPKGH